MENPNIPNTSATCCDCCGDFGTQRSLNSPREKRAVDAVLCDECFNYWSGPEGQRSLLQDAIEEAEERAGWYI